jgi:DNA-binding transcriptional ArsR family regulator
LLLCSNLWRIGVKCNVANGLGDLLMNLELQQFKSDFFKALAHPMRIRILEVLSEGERTVNELQAIVGSEGSGVSQQLAVLRAKNVVNSTKAGTSVVYSLRDPLIKDLLEVAKKIFDNHLVDAISLLENIRKQ